MEFAMSEINDKQGNKGIYRNVSFLILCLTFHTPSRVYIITLWNYETIVYIRPFITGIKGVTQGTVICHVVS